MKSIPTLQCTKISSEHKWLTKRIRWHERTTCLLVATFSTWASRLRSPEEQECHAVVILRQSRCTWMYKFLITKYMSKYSNNQAFSVHCRFYWAKDQKSATLSSVQLPPRSAKKRGCQHLSSTMEQPCSVCIHGYWHSCWCTWGKNLERLIESFSEM